MKWDHVRNDIGSVVGGGVVVVGSVVGSVVVGVDVVIVSIHRGAIKQTL